MPNSNTEFVGSDIARMMATNDAFRRQLELDPVNALASVGVEAKASDLPQQVLLPSSASLDASSSSTTENFELNWLAFFS